jgi:transposase InsO family protein
VLDEPQGRLLGQRADESFFSSLKTELDDGPFETRQAARTALFGFLEGFYNRQRLHSALGYLTPNQKEQIATAA